MAETSRHGDLAEHFDEERSPIPELSFVQDLAAVAQGGSPKAKRNAKILGIGILALMIVPTLAVLVGQIFS